MNKNSNENKDNLPPELNGLGERELSKKLIISENLGLDEKDSDVKE